jgi:succinoglycan biosynthesis transport protein ExoP
LSELEEKGSININETVARVLRFAGLRRWWILVPFCIITVGTAAVLWKLPNRYTSKATLLVVQQKVSERYVTPNSTTDVASDLEAMKQEVLSRTQLLKMITDFDLYPTQRNRIAPEQLMTLILRDIDILPIKADSQQRAFDAFQISFTTENPVLAQRVTTTLTSLFINEYLRTGAEHASSTTSFLHEQVLQKEKELRTAVNFRNNSKATWESLRACKGSCRTPWPA